MMQTLHPDWLCNACAKWLTGVKILNHLVENLRWI
jgi:hypothetical protein